MVMVVGVLYAVESVCFGHDPDDMSVGFRGFDITVSVFYCMGSSTCCRG